MINKTHISILAIAISGLVAGCNQGQQAQLSYVSDIKPVIDSHCAECHTDNGKGVKASGFSVDSYHSLMKGTKYGPVIVAGNPLSSTLYRMVSGNVDPSIQMPHGQEALKPDEIQKIERWIEQGAKHI
jgi:mono/diheme cytochrome c family protein